MIAVWLWCAQAWAQSGVGSAVAEVMPIPQTPNGGFGQALGLLIVFGVSVWGSRFLDRQRRRLMPTGWLPDTLGVGALVLRAFSAIVLFLALVASIPRALAPALPWIALAAAVAVGWSTRAFLTDLFAGVLFRVRRSARPGGWVRVGEHVGEIQALGVFSALLVTPSGEVVLPNRDLMRQPIQTARDARPRAEVTVRIAGEPGQVRQALRDAALLTPWTAPVADLHVAQDLEDPERWTVQVAVLEPRHVLAFTGSFRERALSAFAALTNR